jgi:hypothetical protein
MHTATDPAAGAAPRRVDALLAHYAESHRDRATKPSIAWPFP